MMEINALNNFQQFEGRIIAFQEGIKDHINFGYMRFSFKQDLVEGDGCTIFKLEEISSIWSYHIKNATYITKYLKPYSHLIEEPLLMRRANITEAWMLMRDINTGTISVAEHIKKSIKLKFLPYIRFILGHNDGGSIVNSCPKELVFEIIKSCILQGDLS